MKYLCLIRHAQAATTLSASRDFERELTAHGCQEAQAIPNKIPAAAIHPDLILVSPAKRTLKTCDLLQKALALTTIPCQIEPKLYGSNASTLSTQILALPESAQCVWIISHNPGLSDLAACLSQGKTTYLPTAGVFCCSFEVNSWHDVEL